MSVPSPPVWQHRSQRDSLRLTHSSTATVIELRYWTAQRLATATTCEDDLALRSGEFDRRRRRYLESETLTRRPWTPGASDVGELTARVVRNRDDTAKTKHTDVNHGAMAAWVHGVAVGLGHCIAFDAETVVSDAKGERELAKRVAVLLDDVAASIRMRQVEDRGDAAQSTTPVVSAPRPAEAPPR
jgi:hypothetical protein